MKKLAATLLLAAGLAGCAQARPNEWGYSPVYTLQERDDQIMRNWDYEGKQAVDDFDEALLLRPAGHLTIWDVN